MPSTFCHTIIIYVRREPSHARKRQSDYGDCTLVDESTEVADVH